MSAPTREDILALTRETAALDAGDAAIRISFAVLSAVLELSDRDPRLGAAIVDRLAVMGEGASAGVTALLRVNAECVADRTGAALPALFRPN